MIPIGESGKKRYACLPDRMSRRPLPHSASSESSDVRQPRDGQFRDVCPFGVEADHQSIELAVGRDQVFVARTNTPRLVSHNGTSAASARSGGMEW